MRNGQRAMCPYYILPVKSGCDNTHWATGTVDEQQDCVTDLRKCLKLYFKLRSLLPTPMKKPIWIHRRMVHLFLSRRSSFNDGQVCRQSVSGLKWQRVITKYISHEAHKHSSKHWRNIKQGVLSILASVINVSAWYFQENDMLARLASTKKRLCFS